MSTSQKIPVKDRGRVACVRGVEALEGPTVVPLLRLEQAVEPAAAPVLGYVVRPLPVAEQLNALSATSAQTCSVARGGPACHGFFHDVFHAIFHAAFHGMVAFSCGRCWTSREGGRKGQGQEQRQEQAMGAGRAILRRKILKRARNRIAHP